MSLIKLAGVGLSTDDLKGLAYKVGRNPIDNSINPIQSSLKSRMVKVWGKTKEFPNHLNEQLSAVAKSHSFGEGIASKEVDFLKSRIALGQKAPSITSKAKRAYELLKRIKK